MGRYYDIAITPAAGGAAFRTYSSYPNGQYDPGALNIEFDMPVLPNGTPSGGQTLTIEGISLQDLNQAQQFAGMNLVMKGGMMPGFPLVNPAQAGILVSGQIFQSFGNWIGTEMTLDFVLLPSTFTNDNPGNFVLDWKQGTSLADALKQTLSVAYPNMPVTVNISPNINASSDQTHFCGTLDEMAQFIGDFTEDTFKNRIEIAIQAGKVTAFDKTYQPAPIQLNFLDFIGQPTWIDSNIIQIKTVMRADLQLGSIVMMPQGLQNAPGIITTTGASLPSSNKYKSTFTGSFTVTELRHIGNFRSSDAGSWATVFNMVTNG